MESINQRCICCAVRQVSPSDSPCQVYPVKLMACTYDTIEEYSAYIDKNWR